MSDVGLPTPHCVRCNLDLPIGTEQCPRCNYPLVENHWPLALFGIALLALGALAALWWRSLDWLVFLGGLTVAAIIAAIVIRRGQRLK